MNLQGLRDKCLTMDRQYDADVINVHMEQTVLHLGAAKGFEWDEVIDSAQIKEECIENTDATPDTYPVGASAQRDKQITLVDQADIWLTVSYTVIAYWIDNFAEQDWEINFDSIKLYYMDMEFDLMWSDPIKVKLTKSIISWL